MAKLVLELGSIKEIEVVGRDQGYKEGVVALTIEGYTALLTITEQEAVIGAIRGAREEVVAEHKRHEAALQ